MSNKVFGVLAAILCILIIIALVALLCSILKYNGKLNPEDLPWNKTNVEIQEDETTNVVVVETPQEKPVEKLSSELLYILPSDTREITANDLNGMDKEQLNRAYNEIFARHGHDFKTKSLKDYFKTQTWYEPIEGKTVTPAELTDLENKNKDIIMSRIKEIE